MAFAALFGRRSSDLSVVLGTANTRHFSQEDATRPRRTQLTCAVRRLASRMKNPAIDTAAVEERHSHA